MTSFAKIYDTFVFQQRTLSTEQIPSNLGYKNPFITPNLRRKCLPWAYFQNLYTQLLYCKVILQHKIIKLTMIQMLIHTQPPPSCVTKRKMLLGSRSGLYPGFDVSSGVACELECISTGISGYCSTFNSLLQKQGTWSCSLKQRAKLLGIILILLPSQLHL